MSVQLDQSQRRQGAEYHYEMVAPLQGADYDANDSSLGKDSFRELTNFRLGTLGNIDVRTGYNEFNRVGAADPSGGFIPAIPIGQMEYVGVVSNTNSQTKALLQQEYRYTITPYFLKSNTASSGEVRLWIVDKENALQFDAFLPNPIAVFNGSAPVSDCCEYQNSIVLTLYDDDIGSVEQPHPNGGVYQLFPSSFPITAGTTWSVTKLGKDVSPCPTNYTYLDKTDGPLYAKGFTNVGGTPQPIIDPATGEQEIIELKVKATYWAADNAIVEYMKERLFVQNADEDSLNATSVDKHSIHHPPARAFGYRFVVRRRVLDARGNPFEVVDAPSTDMWVYNKEYCPAVLGLSALETDGSLHFARKIYGEHKYAVSTSDINNCWRDRPTHGLDGCDVGQANGMFVDTGNGGTSFDQGRGWPSNADYLNLRGEYRNSSIAQSQDLTTDPFFFLAVYLGWFVADDTNFPDGMVPYQTAVPASKLKGAPLTMFNWNGFNIGNPVAQSDGSFLGPYQIDIYRTAHTEPNEKDNTSLANSTKGASLQGDLLFQPNLYGYVGTLAFASFDAQGGTFTDDVADTAINFGQTPDDYQGFLAGQFSGTTLRVYNQKLVLGNTRTSYWVNDPWQLPSPFLNCWPDHAAKESFDAPTSFIKAPDGLNVIQWCYTYVDNLGNESAPVDLSIDLVQVQDPLVPQHVTFVFPRGYDPNIILIRVYESEWLGAVRGYRRIAELPTSQNMFSWLGPAANHRSSRPVRTVKDYWAPGDIIWTNLNNPFSWPETNVETHSETFPITGMDSLLGKLWVYTTHSVTLTQADENVPRFEEESREVGCIAQKCLVKFGQVTFFLSEKGLYFAQPSGVVPYPAKCFADVLQYLSEEIPGLPKLANASRASIGILERREELWLYFPSSADLWRTATGSPDRSLPQAIFVYRFINGEIGSFYRNAELRNIQNYKFDLHEDFQLVNSVIDGFDEGMLDPSRFRSEKVWFSAHSDGSLWCGFYSETPGIGTGLLTALDCDYDLNPWPGYAMYEKPIGAGLGMSQKQMRQVGFKGSLDCQATLYTGIRKATGGFDAIRGNLDNRVRGWNVNILRPNKPYVFQHTVSGIALESMGDDWAVRLVTKPSNLPGNAHTASIEALDAYMSLKHHHPG